MDSPKLLHELICPVCHIQLSIGKDDLHCPHCKKIYPIKKGIPIFYGETLVENELTKEYTYWNEKHHTQDDLYENMPDSAFRELLDIFQISNNTRGLELGSGDGPFARRLKNKNLDIYGLDISFPLLTLAENMLPVQGNALQLPFKNLFFDWIIYGFALHHMPAPQKALEEAIRVLDYDARIFIVDPNYYHPIRFFTRKPDMFLRKRVFKHLSPEEEWVPLFQVKKILRKNNVAIQKTAFITPEFNVSSFAGKIQKSIGKLFNFPPFRMFAHSYYLVIGTKINGT